MARTLIRPNILDFHWANDPRIKEISRLAKDVMKSGLLPKLLLRIIQAEIIRLTLIENNWNVVMAAMKLGISEPTVRAFVPQCKRGRRPKRERRRSTLKFPGESGNL